MEENKKPAHITSAVIGDPVAEGTDYTAYRIPGIIVSRRGTVLVYWESRCATVNRKGQGNGDECLMDLFVRRSVDGGNSFGEPIPIARGDEYYRNGYGETVNNPVMFSGADGCLHLLFCCDVGIGGIWYTRSEDDGVTWTKPRNTVSTLRRHPWGRIGLGPGHGICLKNGRLIVPAWLWNPPEDRQNLSFPTVVTTVWSDDNGNSWQMGEIASENRDETCIAELSDGRVMLNSRQYPLPWCESKPPRDEEQSCRTVTVSATGIDGWSRTREDRTLIDPACEGSLCAAEVAGMPRLLLFSNCASRTKRWNLTVRVSTDDGESWREPPLELCHVGWYSDLAVDERSGTVYVLHENGAARPHGKLCMELFRFPISDLL